ncbi:hypothetical protein EUTSA_v10020728mg [Eutrema salsugineum]|uniref:FHA domain-containing protein n=1 Tax=Eutrema salsugineum TaxID=72664 RepID=V4M174_EUTSA|nr:hypothetical protein EUTSA_v10020728mg [Eutrema salsugineum]
MNPPLLKLAFVQGPREGESVEYKPGSTIRIGRIVRGNEIAIKDAGISTKHLRIVSDSEKWIIHDLGSSNGTILNSDTLHPDKPHILRHGDVIKLGEYTSFVVNLETDVQEQHKLPPRPRRNNRRLAVADPDPDPVVPVESVQENRKRKGRPSKQEEHQVPKRSRETRSKTLEEEEAPEEKKGNNSRARGGKKKTENLGLNSIKLEIEDTPKGVEVSAMKRPTRSRQSEDSVVEEKVTCARATRSKRKEIGGDSFLDLEMVLNQARKSRAKKKKMEHKSVVVEEMEDRNDEVEEEDKENEKDVEAQKEEDDDGSKRVEIESRKSTLGEEDLNCAVREDGETDELQDTIDDEGRDRKSEEAGIETSDGGGCDDEEKAEQESSNKSVVDKVEVDFGKMSFRGWFRFTEVNLGKQTVEETEKIIESMRSKSLRVHKHIAEQKQAKGNGSVS